MSRPAQLEAQIERVKELQAKMIEGDTPPVNNDDGETPDDQTPPEPVTPPVSNEPPATISKEDYDKLEQRYRTLQGMHNAEGARLRAELKDALDAIKTLEDRVVAAEANSKKVEAEPVKYITSEDEEAYGDTLDMVRRAAREEAENLARQREQAMLEKIAELQEQLGYVKNVVPTVESITRAQQEQVKAEFWAAIDTNVPNWRTINDNQAFKDWLLAVDPITGFRKQDALRNAQNSLDASRVVTIFKEWERSVAGGQTPAPKNKALSELEKQIAPGASKSAGAVVAPEPKQWTRDEIAKFYKDVTTGKYATRPEERKRIENDIFLAQKEGRVS